MKATLIIALFFLAACGKTSSPEGRMNIKMDEVRLEIDSIKRQNAAILDSIKMIDNEIREMRKGK